MPEGVKDLKLEDVWLEAALGAMPQFIRIYSNQLIAADMTASFAHRLANHWGVRFREGQTLPAIDIGDLDHGDLDQEERPKPRARKKRAA